MSGLLSRPLAALVSAAATVVILFVLAGGARSAETPLLISASAAGAAGNAMNSNAALSGDGRFVVFDSTATNLTASEQGMLSDIFLKDAQTGVITLVSVDSSEAYANEQSWRPDISGDGRYVVFYSFASNLVAGDSNSVPDVFLRDTVSGNTTLISVSHDGGFADAGSMMPTISGDGRYVAFQSNASNIVYGDNGLAVDVFVRDTVTGETVKASTDAGGNSFGGDSYSQSISTDGRHVTMARSGHVYMKDLDTAVLMQIDTDSQGNSGNGTSYEVRPSADGRYVVFSSYSSNLVPNDTNGRNDIFMKDTDTGTTIRVSTDWYGNQILFSNGCFYCASADPAVSDDGRFVSFSVDTKSSLYTGSQSGGSTLMSVIKDTQTGDIKALEPNQTRAEISGNGQYVVYDEPVGDPSVNQVYRLAIGEFDPAVSNNYFPWYDSRYGHTWVLTGSPLNGNPNVFDIWMNANLMPGSEGLQVAAGDATYHKYDQQIGGPVKVTAHNEQPLISERSLFGNSFEEVWATPFQELDSHYYWPIYFGSAMDQWILVANPLENGEAVEVDLTMTTIPLNDGDPDPADIADHVVIQPGQSWAPIYPGVLGSAVEVRAYRSGGSPANAFDSRRVIASQRTLAEGAFNEMPGIGEQDLSSRYFWTWYDNIGADLNFIAVGNPSHNSTVYARVYVNGDLKDGTQAIPAGQVLLWGSDTPLMDGPVEVRGCSDVACSGTALIYASQVSIFGPSYGEIAGTPASSLKPTANWTWYDMQSAGAQNWVMVANTNPGPIYYEIRIAGVNTETNPQWHGTIGSNQRVATTFPGVMGGPVQVSAWTDQTRATPADVMASQRVLWNGYFNELVGLGM